MEKSIYAWLVIGLFILSVALESLALVGASLKPYYGNHTVLNNIAVFFLILDILISLGYLYKLFSFKNDVLLWTDIAWGYWVFRGIFSIIADLISSKGTATSNTIEIIIVLIIWMLFRKHLRKLIAI